MKKIVNIRVLPLRGAGTAAITWSIPTSVPHGNMRVAYSASGTKGTWQLLNQEDPVPSSGGLYTDTRLELDAVALQGFYRLVLSNVDGDYKSESIAIQGDLSRREYGMARAIMHREFAMMRGTDGYPVWHCIPRTFGEPSDSFDPDTQQIVGLECPDTAEEDSSYGLPFKGGFHTPVLTWVRPLAIKRGKVKDSEQGDTPTEEESTLFRMLAFPRPSRGHMLVDPTTDRRYIIGDDVESFHLRGIFPIAYEAAAFQLASNDPRHRFPTPEIDTRDYRKLSYW